MATKAHCLFCLETLAAELEKREALDLDTVQRSYADYLKATESKQLHEGWSSSSPPPPSPLFVTWNTTEGYAAADADDAKADDESTHELRGCIGTFAAQPLAEGLATYALTAALDDSRFWPVAPRELPFLRVAVTLLTDFEPAADAFDWELGKHGLRIHFTASSQAGGGGGRRYSATYLPDVAVEQGWTQEQTIVSLMRKAGWTGRSSQWREVTLQVTRYQGKKRSLSYAEFRRWRDWVDGQKK